MLHAILTLLFFIPSTASFAAIAIIDPGQASFPQNSGLVSSATSNATTLDRKTFSKNEMEFLLKDGTRVGGLLFDSNDELPLLICAFGFLTDVWSAPAAQFVDRYVLPGKIKAHVLIIDHPTAGSFFARNGNLSIGGYDEGRMILEVAQIMKDNQGVRFREIENIRRADPFTERLQSPNFTGIHLMGISMSGNGVIHAVAEDARRQSQLIRSAVTFSAVTDLTEVPWKQLSGYLARADRINPFGEEADFGTDFMTQVGLNVLFSHFKSVVSDLTGHSFGFSFYEVGEFFFESFYKRLNRISGLALDPSFQWNPSIQTRSVRAFAESSNTTQVISQVQAPLVVVHSQDDTAVPFQHFLDLKIAAEKNANITWVGTQDGGHWGFSSAYGEDWIADIIRKILD